MIIQEPVQAAIWHCLNHYDYQDAIFLAERLSAEVETDETTFILATCYYRSQMIHQTYWLLKKKSPRSPQCRYLLAKCAYELKKLVEAETALSSVNFGDIKNFDEIQKEFGELACFVLQLIAKICSQTERKQLAIEANIRALKLNPFLWNSFTDLCNWGEKCDPNAIFQFSSTDIFQTCQGNINTNSMILFGGNNYNNCGFDGGIGGNVITTTTTAGAGDLVNSNSSNYILSTPVLCIDNNLTTPNNNNNNSLNTLRGCGGGGLNNNIMNTIDDTPITYSTTINNNNNNFTDNINSNHNNITNQQQFNEHCTPFRKQFKYLSAFSPSTPSFGVLPISPSDTTPIIGNYLLNQSGSIQTINTITSPQTLVEVNQEQNNKSVGKKLKGHIGSILSRKETPLQNSKPTVFTQTGNITPRTPNLSGPGGGGGVVNNQNVRRSSRLFSNNNYSVKENSKSPNINKFVQPRSPPRKTKCRISKMSNYHQNNEIINEKDINIQQQQQQKNKDKEKIETITTQSTAAINDNKVLLNNSLNNAQTIAHHVMNLRKQSAEGLMALLRELGLSYQQLSQFNCIEAIMSFSNIPVRHLKSSWVQSQLARAYYEQRKYENSIEIFKRIHENEPFRLQYMEIYSTALWHLQREVSLSSLAQDLMAQDKQSPITWCVAGNCFSLHKEHETAIKFFKRAVQVDPNFVYSYTLLGHELVITEELEKALIYFRTAILKDSRHYNAWFGIGTIYSKQERYELAELHYRRALKINPKNSVIIVHIGAMQYFMHKTEQALQTLNTATAVDPKNPLCKFHRGSIYYSLGKHQEALKELEELKQIVPKESVVFYLIGKIHKTLGNVDKALMHFSWATDLDPKGANNQLKDAFDSINHNPRNNEMNVEQDLEIEPVSERSDDSTQAQHDATYDSDSY